MICKTVYLVCLYIRYYFFDIVRTIVELLIIYFILSYFTTKKKSTISLPKNLVYKLIKDWKPSPLVTKVPDESLLPVYSNTNIDLATYDVFNLSHKNKDLLVSVLKEYGVGTCGPRGFFGTLDLHLELEQQISKKLCAEETIVYSNYFACVSSVISCYCQPQDIIFYHKHASEAIQRGIFISKSVTVEFCNLEDFKLKIANLYNPSLKNFVIVEGLCKNTGEIFDLTQLIDVKKRLPFIIILDDSLGMPLLANRGTCEYLNADRNEVDLLIGSLSHGYVGNGAFVSGSLHNIEYQRLVGSSYVFSVSTPAFLTKAMMLNIETSYDSTLLRRIANTFHKKFDLDNFILLSDKNSPLVIIAKKDTYSNAAGDDLLEMIDIQRKLCEKGLTVGVNHNPYSSLRLCLKVDQESQIDGIIKILQEVCRVY